MDVSLLLELSHLCEGISSGPLSARDRFKPTELLGKRRRSKRELVRLYTFANLILCGVGHSFRLGGCPSEMDAERLVHIIGDIATLNTNSILEYLYEDMIGDLKKFSLLSKNKLRKSFSYEFFTETPIEEKLNMGGLRFCLNKLLLLDLLLLYPVTLGLVSSSELLARKMLKVVRRALIRRDYLRAVVQQHKAQQSESTSRLDNLS